MVQEDDDDEEEDEDTFGELPTIAPRLPSTSGGVEGMSGMKPTPTPPKPPINPTSTSLATAKATDSKQTKEGDGEEEEGDAFGELPGRPSGGVEGIGGVTPPVEAPRIPAAVEEGDGEDEEEEGDAFGELPDIVPLRRPSGGVEGIGGVTPPVEAPRIPAAVEEGDGEDEEEEGDAFGELPDIVPLRRPSGGVEGIGGVTPPVEAPRIPAAVEEGDGEDEEEEGDAFGELPDIVPLRRPSGGVEGIGGVTPPVEAPRIPAAVEEGDGEDEDQEVDAVGELQDKVPSRSPSGRTEGSSGGAAAATTQAESDKDPQVDVFRQRSYSDVVGAQPSLISLQGILALKKQGVKNTGSEGKFVLKSDFAYAITRLDRVERFLEERLGEQGSVSVRLAELEIAGRARTQLILGIDKRLEDLSAAVEKNKNRERDGRHRIENAANHTMHTVDKVKQVSGSLDETRDTLRGDLERMAKAFQALQLEVEDLNQSHEELREEAEELRCAMEFSGPRGPAMPGASPAGLAMAGFPAGGLPLPNAHALPPSSAAGHRAPSVAPASMRTSHATGQAVNGGQVAAVADVRSSGSMGSSSDVAPRRRVSVRHGEHSASSGGTGMDFEKYYQLKQQLDGSTYVQTQLLQDTNFLKLEVSGCARASEVKELFGQLQAIPHDLKRLEDMINKVAYSGKETDQKSLLNDFAAKWNPYAKKNLMTSVWTSWQEFVNRANRTRQALQRSRTVYARTHVTTRLRSWWYLMQKDRSEKQLMQISNQLEAHEAHLDNLSSTVAKHEKAATETARGFQHRVLEAEKALEIVGKEKASRQLVFEKFEQLDKRLEQELDMSKIWAAIVEVRGNFKLLEFSKMDQVDMNVDRKKVTDLDRELRAWLQHHEEALKTKASVLEIGEKADSKTVEQVLVLLARQADQLATLV
ncbi:unnamed protein product, partial [Polarella glacialis]